METAQPDPLIAWLKEQAEKTSWREVAIEVGVDEPTVYGWARAGRERIPKWRRAAVEQARERQARKEGATPAQPTESKDQNAA